MSFGLLSLFCLSSSILAESTILNMLCQYNHDLPPLQAEQLIWSRFVNTSGVRGRNISLDLHLEHLNQVVKNTIQGLGANKNK